MNSNDGSIRFIGFSRVIRVTRVTRVVRVSNDLCGEPAGSVAARHAAEPGADEVHGADAHRDEGRRGALAGKQLLSQLAHGHHRIQKGQGQLGDPSPPNACEFCRPRNWTRFSDAEETVRSGRKAGLMSAGRIRQEKVHCFPSAVRSLQIFKSTWQRVEMLWSVAVLYVTRAHS